MTVCAIAALLVVPGCGDDDDGTVPDSATVDQDRVAELVVDRASAQGLEVDEECVRTVVAQITPADARLLAGLGEDQWDVSEEGLATMAELDKCLTGDALIELLIADSRTPGFTMDTDCLRAALERLDLSEEAIRAVLAGERSDEVDDAVQACSEQMPLPQRPPPTTVPG